LVNSLIVTTSTDPFQRGLDYLYGLRSLAGDPEVVDLVYDQVQRVPICTWIGEQIETINRQLQTYLQACHDCFHPEAQPIVQIFAAPLSPAYKIDGLCNLSSEPITLLVDVGRVLPADWLCLVAHEYAHAYTGEPGHHPQFAQALVHLCLGLGILPPSHLSLDEEALRFLPNYRPTPDPLAFWYGKGRL
jgi:hypothetical protein